MVNYSIAAADTLQVNSKLDCNKFHQRLMCFLVLTTTESRGEDLVPVKCI